MGAPVVELGVVLPPRRDQTRAPGSYKPGIGGPRRQATVAIRELTAAPTGASVFVAAGTYAFDQEGIRTAARRAGGSGWYRVRKVEGGWRIWKAAPIVAGSRP